MASSVEVDAGTASRAEAEMAEADLAEELREDETYLWEEVLHSLRQRNDARRMLFLDLFIEKYSVATSVDALVHAPAFLESYLIEDFDYRSFVDASGLGDENMSSEEFGLYERQNLTEDVSVGVSLMMEMVTKVALKMELPIAEVMATMPGGSAVRVLPKAAALSRWLPGGLCTARALRTKTPAIYAGADPFSEDAEAANEFSSRFHVNFDELAVAVCKDGVVKSCCTGTMRVGFVSPADEVCIVSLLPVDLSDDVPLEGGTLTVFTGEGPDVLLEVEGEIGALFEEGMLLDADWFELENGPWFCLNVSRVESGLMPRDDPEDVEDADPAVASTAAPESD